jgi:hypothetical protein
MQFNTPIKINRGTYNQYGEPETASSYDIKCTIMDISKAPIKRKGGKSDALATAIMLPHKDVETYSSIMTTQKGQKFVYDGTEFQVSKINLIPGFSGNYKFYEIVLKEIIKNDAN